MVTVFDVQNLYQNLKNRFVSTNRNFAILKLAVDDNNLYTEYENRVNSHNNMICNNIYADSGVDLLVPNEEIFDRVFDTKFIDMCVKAEMVYCDLNTDRLSACAYNIHPRSSISKTPLMLSNHTGIIDSGYRGSLIGAFRCLASPAIFQNYVVEKHTRLVQVCHPTLCPIYVVLVSANDLSNTERAANGFGSTS
jgi:dUTP pyrophosphatase